MPRVANPHGQPVYFFTKMVCISVVKLRGGLFGKLRFSFHIERNSTVLTIFFLLIFTDFNILQHIDQIRSLKYNFSFEVIPKNRIESVCDWY